MLLSELEVLINNFKILKSDIVYLRGQTIFGVDITFTVVKETQFINPSWITLVVNIKDWMDLFKSLKENNIKYENKVIDLVNSDFITFKGKNYYYKSDFIIRKFEEKIFIIHNTLKNKQPNVLIDNLRKDNKFNTTLDKEFKSSNGAYLYKTQEYCISIYKSLLGIVAKDNVLLDIYDSEDLYFTTRFSLINKTQTVFVYLHLRKLP